jgi:hypothetical protein
MRIPWNKGLILANEPRMKKSLDAAHNALKGKRPWNFGLTKETNAVVASYAKQKTEWHSNNNTSGINNPFYGKKHTEETKSTLSKIHGGTGVPYSNTEYGAEFDCSLREQIRQRDGYKCQECGCSQVENGKQLDVHHIDYDKQNNIFSNLISLCVRCHRKTNHRREYWTEHFKRFIKLVSNQLHKVSTSNNQRP